MAPALAAAEMKAATAASMLLKRELMLRYSEGPLWAESNFLEHSVWDFATLTGGHIEAGAATDDFKAWVHEYGMTIFGNPYMRFFYKGEWITTRRVRVPARYPARVAYMLAEPMVRKLYAEYIAKVVGGGRA